MKHILVIFLVVIVSLTASSYLVKCDHTVNDDIPQSIKEKVQSLYPAASSIEWEKERKGNYEAEFVIDGKKISVLLDAKGNILESIRQLGESELPAQISADLGKREGMRITRAQHITTGSTGTYRVTGVTQDKRFRLEYSGDGKLVNEIVIDKEKKQRIKMEMPARGLSAWDKKWELPFILTEVSGIAVIDAQTMACIQDELGVIYIYDLAESKIREEIPFAGAGDYEGIAVTGKDAWVLRSDGLLYEIINFQSATPKVKEHKLELGAAADLEGLCYDEKEKRLLIAPRGFDKDDPNSKGIYSFDLVSKKFSADPVFRIYLSHSMLAATRPKKGKAALMPSEIAVIRDTVYITDARNSQVLLLDRKGTILDLVPLNRNEFAKTEGIAFSSEGIYFSNEGKKGKPNILRLDPVHFSRD
jgi:hypothetical protein